jgi:hypothetical protein
MTNPTTEKIRVAIATIRTKIQTTIETLRQIRTPSEKQSGKPEEKSETSRKS